VAVRLTSNTVAEVISQISSGSLSRDVRTRVDGQSRSSIHTLKLLSGPYFRLARLSEDARRIIDARSKIRDNQRAPLKWPPLISGLSMRIGNQRRQ
jgi:hypothetical protein